MVGGTSGGSAVYLLYTPYSNICSIDTELSKTYSNITKR